ncbi:MAG TPA: hypothetical protein VLT87_28375 [Thermoanaerobaculia bacterium]|nr:hypothetical protein [Thermoanaerobaculia bacterium]
MAQAWGTITAYNTTTPKVNSGSGNFTISRSAEGAYEIEFAEGTFQNTPALVVVQQYSGKDGRGRWTDFGYGGGDTRDNAVISALDKSKAKVITGNPDGKHEDRNFSFFAIGD